jgi:hypothetical protein
VEPRKLKNKKLENKEENVSVFSMFVNRNRTKKGEP